MKKLELIFGMLIIISLTLKFLLIPGGGTLSLSWLGLAILYYPLGFLFFNQIRLKYMFKKDSYKGISALRIIGAIGFGMGLSTICIGILYKLQHWPLANQFLIIGLVVTFIIIVITVIKYLKTKDSYYLRMINRFIIIGGFGLFLVNVSYMTMTKFLFRNHPDYIKVYEEYIKDPQNEILEYRRATMSEEDFKLYQEYMDNKN